MPLIIVVWAISSVVIIIIVVVIVVVARPKVSIVVVVELSWLVIWIIIWVIVVVVVVIAIIVGLVESSTLIIVIHVGIKVIIHTIVLSFELICMLFNTSVVVEIRIEVCQGLALSLLSYDSIIQSSIELASLSTHVVALNTKSLFNHSNSSISSKHFSISCFECLVI